MATGTAVFGTALVFVGAYLLEKTQGGGPLRGAVRMLSMLPMAVPGLVLGLGYIFFFNEPDNPLNGLYQTLTLLTMCTIVHFYTTGHLTAVTALKSLDAEFESVSASLKVPFYKTFWRVTLPICTPALVDIARYFFVNAMTTISAVVFLYSPETKVASIAILNLDEAGDTGAAAAMALLIAAASTVATLLFMALSWLVERRTQAWKSPEGVLMDRDRILLTPGPLTTTLRTKLAMLKDWGSWDADFNAVTARLRSRLLDIVHGHDTHVVVPLQGSGTFSVEAAVATRGAARRPCAGARQRRLLQARRQADADDGPQGQRPGLRRGRSRSRPRRWTRG